jgi:hypothetical protein
MTNEEKARACLDRMDLGYLYWDGGPVVHAMVQFALEHANAEVERRRAAEAEVAWLTARHAGTENVLYTYKCKNEKCLCGRSGRGYEQTGKDEADVLHCALCGNALEKEGAAHAALATHNKEHHRP